MSDTIPVVTPVGELWYLNISGQGKRNYNDDGYEYTATVHLTGQAALDLKAKVDAVMGPIPSGKTIKSLGYRELLKDAEGVYTPTLKTAVRDSKAEKTGIFAFAFKTGATFTDGRQAKIAVYNTAAQKVDMGDRLIGNGSKGAISGSMQRGERGKEVYVSLYLKAVQLTEYVPYVADAGFDAQEGQFTAPTDGEAGFTGTAQGQAKDDGASAQSTQTAKPRL